MYQIFRSKRPTTLDVIQLAAEVCSPERIFEPAADVPAPQIQETIRDVIQHASQIRKTGHDVTHLAPQLNTAGCIFDVPVPRIQETILDASQLVPQGCSPECIVQQTAVLPSSPVVKVKSLTMSDASLKGVCEVT